MSEEKILLSTKDIFEKEFKVDARGYRPQEVDKFLDIIINDYNEYNKLIRRYNDEFKMLMNENKELKNHIRDLKSKIDMASDSKGVTNVDVLKRISELEKTVYGE